MSDKRTSFYEFISDQHKVLILQGAPPDVSRAIESLLGTLTVYFEVYGEDEHAGNFCRQLGTLLANYAGCIELDLADGETLSGKADVFHAFVEVIHDAGCRPVGNSFALDQLKGH